MNGEQIRILKEMAMAHLKVKLYISPGQSESKYH
jgi:hypothetical protein